MRLQLLFILSLILGVMNIAICQDIKDAAAAVDNALPVDVASPVVDTVKSEVQKFSPQRQDPDSSTEESVEETVETVMETIEETVQEANETMSAASRIVKESAAPIMESAGEVGTAVSGAFGKLGSFLNTVKTKILDILRSLMKLFMGDKTK